MSDQEIISKTINYLKPKSGHINIRNTIWKDLTIEKQMQLRQYLVDEGLIHLADDNWAMKLTAKGLSDNIQNISSEKLTEHDSKNITNIHHGDNLHFSGLDLKKSKILVKSEESTQNKQAPAAAESSTVSFWLKTILVTLISAYIIYRLGWT